MPQATDAVTIALVRTPSVDDVGRAGQTGGMAAMTPIEVARLRLVGQGIQSPLHHSPVDTVRHLTAMQGQDLPGVLWSIGSRTIGATEAGVRSAFDRGEIVRSWPMRGTLHVTTPDDLRLILPLSRHRLATAFASRRRELAISDGDILSATDVAQAVLPGQPLPRKALFAAFESAGQSTTGQRGIHLISALAHAGLVCLGPFAGREQAFVLLDEWAPAGRTSPGRDSALDEVALRYYLGHGPATIADLSWWANLTLADVRAATARVAERLGTLTVGSTTYYASPDLVDVAGSAPGSRSVHLVSGFDENLLGYTDRSPALDARHSPLIVPGNNGVFKPTIVAGGRIVGTWARAERASSVTLTAHPFDELGSGARLALSAAAERYALFRHKPVDLVVAPAMTPSSTL